MSLVSSFGLDPVIEAKMREHGYVFDAAVIEASRALFADRKDTSLPPESTRKIDIPYGDHARQKLDICSPGVSRSPIVLFVPGGGLVGGDKSLYAHIPAFFARRGFVGVGMNYRLAPDFVFPAGAADVAQAIDWLVENVHLHGGDPDRIFIIGQSAGAIHSASTIFDARCHPRNLKSVRSIVLMSGVYEVEPDHEVDSINIYFGNDPDDLKDRSSCHHVEGNEIPVIITVAELEPGFLGTSAAALMHALSQQNNYPAQCVWLKGHNHLSPVLNMGAPGDTLGPAIADAFQTYL